MHERTWSGVPQADDSGHVSELEIGYPVKRRVQLDAEVVDGHLPARRQVTQLDDTVA